MLGPDHADTIASLSNLSSVEKDKVKLRDTLKMKGLSTGEGGVGGGKKKGEKKRVEEAVQFERSYELDQFSS